MARKLSRRAALTMAVAAAPAGAAGTGRPVVHFEIGCRDRAKTAAFFSELFGWQIDPGPAANIPAAPGGIPGHLTALGHEPQHYTMFYVEVEDAKASLDKAVALGGKALVGPVKIPTGFFAWFSDPEGNIIGLLQNSK